MFSHFFEKKTNAGVGLDIGNSSIKLIQLQALGPKKTPTITGFAIEPIQGQDAAACKEAIVKTVGAAKIVSKLVNTSVSGQTVIVRYVQMPKMTSEELANALRLSAGKYIPFPLNEVNYDYQILGSPAKTDKTMRVLLVAVKKDIIDERMRLMQEVGLSLQVVDVDSFAIVNSFQLMNKEHTGAVAVVDIGADTTTTTVLVNNAPYFSRDVPIGGNDITDAVMQEFDVDAKEAEALKANPQENYGDLLSAIKSTLDSLSRELHMSFNYCESQIGMTVSKVYVSGGTAKFKGIDKVLTSILGVEVEVWDPTRFVEIAPQVPKEQIYGLGPLLTVAIGLALRSC